MQLQSQTVLSGTYSGGPNSISGDVIINSSTIATFTNGTTFTGANATFNNSAGLYWQQAGTLASKALTFGSGAYIYVTGVNNTLTLDSATTATGDITMYTDGSAGTAITNQGTLTHNSSSTGQIYSLNFTNSGAITATAGTLYLGNPSAGYNTTNTGTVTADGASSTVYLRGNFANTGTVTAQNSGVLMYDGTNTTANLGTVVLATGGHARLNGTIDNTSATLNAPTGGTYELYGGTIKNGTIASGALTFTSSGGYLDGATLTGDLSLATSNYVRFTNGASFTGTNLSLGNSAGLYWQQAGILAGKALTFGSGAYIYVTGVNNTLTLGSGTTATGDISIYTDGSAGTAITNQGTLTHNSSSTGQIYSLNFTNSGAITATAGTLYLGYPSTGYNTANTGTVTADGASTTVYLRGNFANTGTVTAQNSGVLLYDGVNSTGNLGNVVLSTGGHARLNGTINNTTLSAPTGGTFELYGGTISGGTVAAGALSFTTSGGYLDNTTFTGDLNLATSNFVRLTNGAVFTGTNLTLANSAGVYWQQAGALTSKALTFGSGAYIYVTGVNDTLTLDGASTVTGTPYMYSDGSAGTAITNQGTITQTAGSGQIYSLNFTNSGAITATAGTLYLGYPSAGYNSTNTSSGAITANGSGTTVYLRGNFANNGTITAQNSGQLLYDGVNSTGNLGNVVLSTGGRALLNGTINNTTLNAPTGGTFELYGGTISGGTVAAGALSFTTSGGYLDNTTYTGDLNLATSNYVRFTNGASFTGTNLSLASSAGLYWQQAGILAGKALTFGSGAYLYVTGVNNTLTLDSASTVTGTPYIYTDSNTGTAITNQGTITQTAGSGQIYSLNFTNSGAIMATAGTLYLGYPSAGYNTTNTGTVTADGASTTVYLRGNFDNNGTVTAQNSGVLLYDGTNTTANLGNVVLATGGHARLNGTIDNTSTTLNAPSGGIFELLGGTIKNGVIAAGALGFTTSGGYLDGASLAGDLNLGASNYVRLTNGASFSGPNLSLGSSAALYWQQAGTLTSKSLNFGSSAFIYVTGVNNTLTLDSASTATGTPTIYTDGSTGTAITNLGTITQTTGTGQIYSLNFTNSGTITATAGTLYLGYPSSGYNFANTAGATINVTGANVYVRAVPTSPTINNGLINVQSGTLFTSNALTNGATGTIKGSGTINGNLTVAGGTLAPGNSIGNLTLASSAFAVTAASTFAVEIGGTASDQLIFQNPTANVDIGSGLLNLSITLLSAPTPITNYTIMSIAGGVNTFAGRFAGLPNSGDSLIATFGPTQYTLTVNYLPTAITLSIPEPSTYALMGVGLALFAFRRRFARR